MGKDFKKQSPKTKGTKKFAPRTGDTRESSNKESIHWNDWSWYAASEQLLKDAASFPFSRPLGVINPIDTYTKDIATTQPKGNIAIPGIFVLRYLSTIGISDNDSSNVNVASRQIYSFIRHANSGHANYEAPDLMMYLIAMGEVYGWIATLDRLYGTCRYYARKNRYTGMVLTRAMGFNYDSMISELADLRQFINITKKRVSALCVPKTMSYFARRFYLNSYIFKDCDSERAQLYLFKQTDLYQLSATKLSTGTSLFRYNLDDNLDLGDIKTVTNELLEPLLSDEDFNIMSGDILKAFNKEGCWSLVETPDDYVVIPEHNIEILDQIHNATQVTPDINYNTPTGDYEIFKYRGIVHQVDGSIRNYEFSESPGEGQLSARKDILLDLDEGHTDPKDVMVATRLSNISTPQSWDTGVDEETGFLATGTELVTGYRIYYYKTNSQTVEYEAFSNLSFNKSSVSADAFRLIMFRAGLLSVFHKHPGIVLTVYDDEEAILEYFGEIKEIDDYTLLKPKDLQDLHEVATLSLFSIPSLT